MNGSILREQLDQLLDLLQQERESAMALDMQRLEQIVAAKQELLANLNPQKESVVGMEDLLKQIDHENRRNAFLLWTGLGWVRDLMGFFGQATAQQVYGDNGQSQSIVQEGRILSGKV